MERLLFVCTGNVCRSPMAEAIASAILSKRGAEVAVVSAGLLGAGRPTTTEAEAVMQRRHLDLTGHRSRKLTDELDANPDLVVAMARGHARAVVELAPDLFPRTFTLKDLVRRATEEGRRRADEPLQSYLHRLAQGRKPWDLVGGRPDEDVADPIGRPKRVYERCAVEIEGLVEALIEQVWPPRATETTVPSPAIYSPDGTPAAGGPGTGGCDCGSDHVLPPVVGRRVGDAIVGQLGMHRPRYSQVSLTE